MASALKRAAFSLLSLWIAGCAGNPPAPPDLTAGIKTVTVDHAVATPCVKPADVPECPATTMPDPNSDIRQLAAGASADLRLQVQCAEKLRAMLIACATGDRP